MLLTRSLFFVGVYVFLTGLSEEELDGAQDCRSFLCLSGKCPPDRAQFRTTRTVLVCAFLLSMMSSQCVTKRSLKMGSAVVNAGLSTGIPLERLNHVTTSGLSVAFGSIAVVIPPSIYS